MRFMSVNGVGSMAVPRTREGGREGGREGRREGGKACVEMSEWN